MNLVRKGWLGGAERADYPANFEQVSRLLQKIWNLKPVQTLQVGPSQLGRFELVEPANGAKGGTLFELKDKDEKRIAAFSRETVFQEIKPEFWSGRRIRGRPLCHAGGWLETRRPCAQIHSRISKPNPSAG